MGLTRLTALDERRLRLNNIKNYILEKNKPKALLQTVEDILPYVEALYPSMSLQIKRDYAKSIISMLNGVNNE